MLKDILVRLAAFEPLSKTEAEEILTLIGQGECNTSQMAAFMAMYMMRPVTVAELEGFRDALMKLRVKVDLAEFDPIDLCGTGGDGKNTFNISTLSAFVVAAAGQPVAKHGNYGVSSRCGSSNLLEFFGYRFTNEEARLQEELYQTNITFLHAPKFHPAMKHVAGVRKELGTKTFFNMLGPLVNPSDPQKQLAGVFSHELARIYHYLFQQSEKRYAILYDLEGYDECSLTGELKVFTHSGEQLMSPADFNRPKHEPEAIHGGAEVEDAAGIFLKILKGEGTPAQQNVVECNAALALQTAGKYQSLNDCLQAAREAIESGKAYNTFKKVMTLQENIPA